MRYILSLFLTLALFCTPSFSQKKDTYRVRTVVIDPGHGGVKPGAQGSRVQEKTLTLAIAKKFGKLITDNYPDVKVIFTRTTDVDISLAERAHIANRNKADLFISIHANSHPTTAPTGVETFVMGLSESRANLAVAQKENADILLEADYKDNADYQGFDPNSPESYVMLAMFQNAFLDKSLNFAQAIQTQYKQHLKTINRGVKQAELYVLYKTTCPSVLTEVGFISNPTEEAYMMSDEGQARIALCLFNAFMNYKATEEGTSRIANPKIDIPGAPKNAAPKEESVEEKTSVAEEKKPAVEEKAPVVEEKAPVVEEKKPVVEEKKPVVEEKKIAVGEKKPVVIEKVPVVEKDPKVTEKADEAVVEVVELPEQRPVPTAELVVPQDPPAQKSQKDPNVSNTPKTTKPQDPAPTEFFTVQFLTSNTELREGAPEFKGLKEVMVARNGKLYCYSVGRFNTFTEANEYCKKIQKETPFKDAWALRRLSNHVQYLAETPAPSTAQNPPKTQKPQNNQNPPKTQSNQDTPKTTTSQAATQPSSGTFYRIQFCTSSKVFKVGAPEMHGIKDFQYSKSGSHYLYTAGNYKTLAEARKRCSEIQNNTPFKDAFVVCFKNGKRVKIE